MKNKLKKRRRFIFKALKESIKKVNELDAFVKFFSLMLKIDRRLHPEEYKKLELVDNK